MKMRAVIIGLLFLFGAISAPYGNVGGTDDAKLEGNKREEEVLRTLDLAWSKTANRKDIDGIVSYMADDGETLAPNEPVARGKGAIRASWANLISLPGFTVHWEPVRVQVAKSGDIGYTSGFYTLSYTIADGKTVSDRGKYLEVWTKVNDKWKCSSDAYNSDLPAK